MRIEVEQYTGSDEWRATIPLDHWDDFLEYARETRLPLQKRATSREGVSVALPEGLSAGTVEEVFEHFFDGIAEVIVVRG